MTSLVVRRALLIFLGTILAVFLATFAAPATPVKANSYHPMVATGYQ